MKTLQINLNELANYELAPHIIGFGLCGYNNTDGGYIYASEGYGNLESYCSIEELLPMLEEDGMKTGLFEVSLNEEGKITQLHVDVWPAPRLAAADLAQVRQAYEQTLNIVWEREGRNSTFRMIEEEFYSSVILDWTNLVLIKEIKQWMRNAYYCH